MTAVNNGVAKANAHDSERRCANPRCGKDISDKRSDAQTCSARCRKAESRNRFGSTCDSGNDVTDSRVPRNLSGPGVNITAGETSPEPALRELMDAATAAEHLRLVRQELDHVRNLDRKRRGEANQAHRLAGQVAARDHRIAELEQEITRLSPRCPALVPDYPIETIAAALGSTEGMQVPGGRGRMAKLEQRLSVLESERIRNRAEKDQMQAELLDESPVRHLSPDDDGSKWVLCPEFGKGMIASCPCD